MSRSDDDRPPAGPVHARASTPAEQFSWSVTCVDDEGQPITVRLCTTDDDRVCIEVGGATAFLDIEQGVDASAGLRLAIEHLRPGDRWWP